MPRRARMYLPELPYPVVQRGNNRQACFIEPENYPFYLILWEELSPRYGLAMRAYCRMTNPVHFRVTPGNETAVSNTMKVAGSRPIHQQEIPPYRHAVGRSPPVQPRADRALPAHLYALHRTEPGTGRHGAPSGGIPLVELGCQGLGRPPLAHPAPGISALRHSSGRTLGCLSGTAQDTAARGRFTSASPGGGGGRALWPAGGG